MTCREAAWFGLQRQLYPHGLIERQDCRPSAPATPIRAYTCRASALPLRLNLQNRFGSIELKKAQDHPFPKDECMSTVQRILLPDTSLTHSHILNAVGVADRLCEASGTRDVIFLVPAKPSDPKSIRASFMTTAN